MVDWCGACHRLSDLNELSPGAPGECAAGESRWTPARTEQVSSGVAVSPTDSATPAWTMRPWQTLRPLASAGFSRSAAASALPGELDDVGQGGVGERERGRARHEGGHVGHAVVHDAVDQVDGVGERRRVHRLDAAALVHRDVDDHRALLHRLHRRLRDQDRRARAGDQDGADQEVGALGEAGDVEGVRDTRVTTWPRKMSSTWRRRSRFTSRIDTSPPRPTAIFERVEADGAGAEDHHVARRHAGDAGEQDAPARRAPCPGGRRPPAPTAGPPPRSSA